MERPSLSTGQRIIVALHAMLAGAFFVTGGIDSGGGGDGFSDLARIAVLIIVGLYVLATVTVTATARYFVSASFIRYALIALGPPVLMAIAILAVRGA
jgi:predicted transporter